MVSHQVIRFAEFDLPEPLRHGIADAGFVDCTPIQASTLPLAFAGKDIAGQAQTGTGKTAAYLIALYNRLLRAGPRRSHADSAPAALVVAPTRELVVQIQDDAHMLGKHCGLIIHAVYGGVDYVKQLERLKSGVDVLIGTPGRLIDYYRQKAYSLDRVEVLVIDEADRMFDMGFIDDIRYLIRRLPVPKERQSFLYSATLSHRVLELAYEHMNEVERVAISEDKVTADNITQVVYHVGMEEKLPLLLGLLSREQPSRALVFVNTRSIASLLAEALVRHGYAAGALAGDIDQRKRLKLLASLKDGTLNILVATDVASRGLHIERVSHVFNYDLPQDPEDYVHRIGRTARAGASGKAVSLACEKYVYSLEAIEEFIGAKLSFELPDPALLVAPVGGRSALRAHDRRRGGAGGREQRRTGRQPQRERPRPAVAESASIQSDSRDPGRRRRRRRRPKEKPASQGVPVPGD